MMGRGGRSGEAGVRAVFPPSLSLPLQRLSRREEREGGRVRVLVWVPQGGGAKTGLDTEEFS